MELQDPPVIFTEKRNSILRYIGAVKTVANLFDSISKYNPSIEWMIHAGGALVFWKLPEVDMADIDIVIRGITPQYLNRELRRENIQSYTIKNRSFSRGVYLGNCIQFQINTGEIVHVFNPLLSQVIIDKLTYDVPFTTDTFERAVKVDRNIHVARLEDIMIYKLMLFRRENDGKRDLEQILAILKYGNIDYNYLFNRIVKLKLENFLLPIYYGIHEPEFENSMLRITQSDIPVEFYYIAGQLLGRIN